MITLKQEQKAIDEIYYFMIAFVKKHNIEKIELTADRNTVISKTNYNDKLERP